MVGWHKHLQSVIRNVGRRWENSYQTSIRSYSHYAGTSVMPGKLAYAETLRNPIPLTFQRPLYNYIQQLGISSSRKLLADASDATPISSPLTPLLTSGSGKDEEKKVVEKREKVEAILKKIKMSPKKLNLVAALIRGMRVEDALLQLQVTVKRASNTVYQVLHSARANATHNHGLDPDRLLVAEAFVGKGLNIKRYSYHAKGKCGVRLVQKCRLTVVVREMTAEEETKLARLKVMNFKNLSRSERRLYPHKLIETTPIWNRRGTRPSGDTRE
ncbi:50S ribosomal protein L22, chloroplastic-like isoform X2 [Impatiens glandulifera]|uniref:50S ribosomal protein L22, chloroplastic-like isoform X2 n=1 Tax=Impatiens glandulifera TaxID=253017 RepID=UPI001FB06D6A|nr:50S ribosomal protein L22, chloroplastic-like isoform X2 [Impatiens glandulifera]